MQQRAILTPSSKPIVPKHVHLQFDNLRGKWVVLAPESVFWPDEQSLEILKLCDGKTSVKAMIEHLAKQYAAPKSVIEPDVTEFLQEWSDKLLIRVI